MNHPVAFIRGDSSGVGIVGETLSPLHLEIRDIGHGFQSPSGTKVKELRLQKAARS